MGFIKMFHRGQMQNTAFTTQDGAKEQRGFGRVEAVRPPGHSCAGRTRQHQARSGRRGNGPWAPSGQTLPMAERSLPLTRRTRGRDVGTCPQGLEDITPGTDNCGDPKVEEEDFLSSTLLGWGPGVKLRKTD